MVPLKPASAPTRNSATTQTSITVDYATPTSTYTGGSTILSLHLQYDNATSGATWTTLIGYNPTSTTTTYTISGSQVVTGSTYKFRYRASNIHGWGSYSDTVDVIAAEVP